MADPVTAAEIAELVKFCREETSELEVDFSDVPDAVSRAQRLCAIAEKLPALLAERETLEKERDEWRALYSRDLDPPVCRLQVPDGWVPGNAREAAEGWHATYEQASADRDALKKERDDAVTLGWKAAHDAVLSMQANWHQDCRSDEQRNALMEVATSIADELRHMSPGDYLDVKWKDAQNAIASERRAEFAESERDRLAAEVERMSKERDGAFDEWIRELDEDVIQGEYGYERGEFTVYPDHWRPAFDEGLSPECAFARSLKSYDEARKERDREAKANYERIKLSDRATLAEFSLSAARETIAKLREALDEIGGLSRYLRHGGCDASDLPDLEEGLSQAVDMAHNALSISDATSAPGHTDLMISPEAIDEALATDPLPEELANPKPFEEMTEEELLAGLEWLVQAPADDRLAETERALAAARATITRLTDALKATGSVASALLNHFNPTNLPEAVAQQWFALHDQVTVFNAGVLAQSDAPKTHEPAHEKGNDK